MTNKWIYILLFGLLCSKPITNVITSYDNGLPKVIHTYDLKRNELQLTEQQHFYENGTLKAKGLLRRDAWEWSYYGSDGKKLLEPIALDETNTDLYSAVSELQNNQLLIVKQIQALAKEQQNLKNSASNKSNNKQNKPQADPNKVYDIPIGDSVVIGNPNAKVTIIEWTDFQ